MKIDTLGVQAFVAIADHGRFQKAADSLHITQTALTRRLQNLERSLGVKLVDRTTRSNELSTIGRAFLPQARRLLGELSMVLTEIRETGKALSGDVSIACVPTVGVQWLPRVIQRYSARYPHNRIRILDHTSAGVATAVLSREAEFGIHIAGPRHPDLVSVPLLRDRFVLICRDDHPLASRRRIRWAALASYPLILAGQGSSNRPLLDQARGTIDALPRAFYEVQRSSTAVGLVVEGLGVAVVPRLAIQDGAFPSVRVVPLVDPVVHKDLALVTRRNGQLSPAAEALQRMIRAHAVATRSA
jgi:DNA-binding transcriptional LysR family regulator